MRPTLDNRVLDWLGRWRFSTRSLINLSLQSHYGSHNELLNRLMRNNYVSTFTADRYNLFAITETGRNYIRAKTSVKYPALRKHSLRPTGSLYHDLYSQYVAALMVTQEDRFKPIDRVITPRMWTFNKQKPDLFLPPPMSTVVEVELWEKNRKRVFHRYLQEVALLDKGVAKKIVYIFRSDNTRNKYRNWLNESEWPVFTVPAKTRSLIQRDKSFYPEPQHLAAFQMMTIDELDGRPTDDERVK